jgi:hypothetical protein
MIKKSVFVALLVSLSYGAICQSTDFKKTKRPDIPGTFALELGINRLTERPKELGYGFWGSRTFNFYYQYDIRIGQSKFTFHPGIGMGMERFKLLNFKNYFPNDTVKYFNPPTLVYDNAGNTDFAEASHYIYDADTLGQINWSSSYSTKKSMMALNYVDIPLELRFNTNPEDPARSFKIAIGGRVGYLINAHTKIKYKENGDFKKLQNSQYYNLNRLRYSASLKIYMGNFSVFGYYNLSPLWEKDKGPGKTQTTHYTVGIALSSF